MDRPELRNLPMLMRSISAALSAHVRRSWKGGSGPLRRPSAWTVLVGEVPEDSRSDGIEDLVQFDHQTISTREVITYEYMPLREQVKSKI
jgi:hypothetical protein